MSIEDLYSNADATALGDAVRQGEVSPADLVEAAIDRVERVNPAVNAVVERLYEAARAEAQSVDRRLPFAGVPIAIKDLEVSMRGVPCHSGSRMPPRMGEVDATIVKRYRAAGFVPIVTSTSPEFGIRLVTESERFGITRNPWNTGHVTGGSSGGAAALVSSGAIPVAHASDGGGSIRVPAACTGLVGLKPSRGRVPMTPGQSEGWSGFVMQHAVTRTVRDSALMLDLVAGADALTPYSARPPATNFADAAARRLKGLRIGVFARSPLGSEVSADTQAALDTAVAAARDAGHRTEEIDLPVLGRDFFAAFSKVVAAFKAAELREHALRTGASQIGTVERSTRIVARFGEVLSAGEVFEARLWLDWLSREVLRETAQYDAVLMPIIAHPPLPCGSMDPTGMDLISQKMVDSLHLTRLLKIQGFLEQLLDQSFWFTPWPAIQNVTGQPAISLPVYQTAAGLPLGVQAVGRIGDEETLLSLAAELEDSIGWREIRSPMARDLAAG